jgi:hypothetical protein
MAAVLPALNWGATRKRSEQNLDVRTLLRRVGELHRPGATTSVHAGRIADRLEEALLRLTELHILPNRLFCDEATSMRAQSRRWFDAWCQGQVSFARPPFILSDDIEAVRKTSP